MSTARSSVPFVRQSRLGLGYRFVKRIKRDARAAVYLRDLLPGFGDLVEHDLIDKSERSTKNAYFPTFD